MCLVFSKIISRPTSLLALIKVSVYLNESMLSPIKLASSADVSHLISVPLGSLDPRYGIF
jgi:hypothetical protein